MDEEARRSHGGAFDRAAEIYAASRPSYPREAAEWALGSTSRRVLDLGAGTGALTTVLVELGHEVVAADPSEAMLRELKAEAVCGSRVRARGEGLPFADGCFDAITVAGAFHWMDPVEALPELARVLRPYGIVGLLYNTRVDSTSCMAELTSLLESAQPPNMVGRWGSRNVGDFDGSELFTPRDYREIRWAQPLDRAHFVGLAASRSYVINLDDVRRTDLLQAVSDLFDRHANGTATLDVPYRTQVWKARRL